MISEGLKVKDLKYEGKGVFYYINENKPFTFTELISIESLQLGFDILHGEKLVTPYIANMFNSTDYENSLNEIGKVINVMFRNKWDKLINVYENEINLNTYQLLSVNEETIKGSNTNTKENNSENERLIQKSSFDSDVLVDDDKETNNENSTVTDTGESENIISSSKEVTGNISNRLDDILKFTELLNKTVVRDIIYTDVKQFIGLSIY